MFRGLLKGSKLFKAIEKVGKLQEEIDKGLQEAHQARADLEEEIASLDKAITIGHRMETFLNSITKGE